MTRQTTQSRLPELDHGITVGQRRMATAWLILGIGSLALAGIFAILLVIARIPGTEPLFPTQDFFRVALTVHVDQSVLIWFLAFSGVLFAAGARAAAPIARIAVALAVSGCLLVAAAPFLGAGTPLLSNYVPVLDHPLFLTALGLFTAGATIQVLSFASVGHDRWSLDDPLRIGIITVAFAALLMVVTVFWTWATLPGGWEGKAYYEYLFWGPGHVLQFAYTQLMLVAWLWLAQSVGRPIAVGNRILSWLLILGALPLLTVALILTQMAPDSPESRLAFTRLMQWGNGLAAVPIGVLLISALVKGRRQPLSDTQIPQYRALQMSWVLFIAGGLLGASIGGVNTIVPAHYHGSIVGVTLALMGLTYLLLPRLGFLPPGGRMARWQPWVYAGGQLLHIGGLAASGAMGIERKTAGAAQGLDSGLVKAFMGIMGLGGLLAVIGGILFVLVVLNSLLRRPIART